VRGVPTSFKVGPLVFHIYGFGLAITAYVAYLYAHRRFTRRRLDVGHFAAYTGWILVAALIGARGANIATNWSYYSGHPGRMIAVWQGGLASFGGIGVALVVGLLLKRRFWPDVALTAFTDALVPALVAAWALGRVLGPQFEVAGGGHLTHSWVGLSYQGQTGKRVPVPLFQGAEDGTLWLILIYLEHRGWGRARGLITGVGLTVWGLVRTFDEHYLLGGGSNAGSRGVELAGLVLAATGAAVLVAALARRRPYGAHDARRATDERSTA
jgi:phosphatidylglycerol---prolipoprotein diacylglyceryl transferase